MASESDTKEAYRLRLVENARQRSAVNGGRLQADIQKPKEEEPGLVPLTDQSIREAIKDVMENLGDKDWKPKSRIAAQILRFAREDEHEFEDLRTPYVPVGEGNHGGG
jgi:hypothetical protein